MVSRARIIAGIDIGSSKTATLIGSIGEEEETVKVLGASSIPSKGIRKGQIVNIEEAAESLLSSVEAAERMAGYNLTRAFVAVGGPQLASQNSNGVVAVAEPEVEITPADITRVIEAARAVSLPSSRETIHVLPRYFTVDGQEGVKDPGGMSGIRLEVETHIITGSATAMRNLVKCIAEVGADVQGLVANGLAAAESILTETEKELGVILVDIGGGTTNVIIFVEGAPFYTAVIPVGAKNVTNDLAIGLRLSLEAAEKIKISLSEEKKKPALPQKENKAKEKNEDEISLSDLGIVDEQKMISKKTLSEGIIRPRLSEIFTLVGMEVKKSGAAGLTPSGIVVCGGGALTVGVAEAAKRTLSLPVRIGRPQGISGLIDDVQTPEFAVATGLLIYGAHTETKPTVSFSLGQLGKALHRVSVKGIVGRTLDLIKSFLP